MRNKILASASQSRNRHRCHFVVFDFVDQFQSTKVRRMLFKRQTQDKHMATEVAFFISPPDSSHNGSMFDI